MIVGPCVPRLELSLIRCLILVQVLELATDLPIIYTMHLHSVYLSSRMSAHILADCRGTRDGQTEEEEDTK